MIHGSTIESTIESTTARYDELIDCERQMTALEASGVDNWEWYGESLKEYYAGKFDYVDELDD